MIKIHTIRFSPGTPKAPDSTYSIGKKEISSFSFDVLESIILRISETHAPSGAEAVITIEPFFPRGVITDVKEGVTRRLINQMYEWLSWGDDYSASLCVAPLEKLGTDMSIRELKTIAAGSLAMGWISENIAYAEQDAINGLGQIGEIEYLLDWLSEGLPYANCLTAKDVIQVVERHGNINNVPKLNLMLSISTDQEIIQDLKKAIETISTRVK
jgi:hypothetical protein